MTITSIALVIIGVSQAIEAWEDYRDTTPLVDYARRNTEAAEKFADNAQKINNGMHDAVSKLDAQASRMDRSVQQAARLARDTEIANENAVQADRPWFGAMATVTNFEVGKIPVVTVTLVNSGRRPAKITESLASTRLYREFPKEPTYTGISNRSTGIVVPNASAVNQFSGAIKPLSQQDVDAAAAGVIKAYAYAKIDYMDVRTGKGYYAHFCWLYIANEPTTPAGFYSCPEYNETGDLPAGKVTED